MTELREIGFGIVGAGAMGRHHLRLLASHGLRPVAVADTDEAALESVRGRWPAVECLRHHEALLADPRVDLVDVVLPHHLHGSIAREALGAGKHVILEKPPAITMTVFDDLVDTARRNGRRLFVKAYRRSAEFTALIARECAPGRLGRPELVSGYCASHRRGTLADAADWRASWEHAGGGVLFDVGYHFLDWLRYLFGPVRSVSAGCWGSAGRPHGRPDDQASVTIELCSGLIATFSCSWAAAPGPPRWHTVVSCANGSAEERDTRDRTVHMITSAGGTARSVHEESWDKANEAALLEVFRALLDERPSVFDAEHARDTLELLLACYRSAASGHRLNLDDRDSCDFRDWRPDASCLTTDYGYRAEQKV